jgi:hypothetical protein
MVEVFDGLDCGWMSHHDPDKPNRTVRTVEEAAEQPISHPRCQRAIGSRSRTAILAWFCLRSCSLSGLEDCVFAGRA